MALRRTLGLAAASLALAACAAPGASPSALTTPQVTPPAATATAAPTATSTPTSTPAATDTPTTAPTAALTLPPPNPACDRGNLTLKNPGRLTLSTDIPAFPPWWGGDPATQYPNEPDDAPEWELSDPYSMMGYESATAYAIAEALGFAADEVDWIPNAVFAQAFAPGEKAFDFHMAQISIRPERAEAVDFSDPYFDANQSILALTPNPITGARTIEELKAFRLGAAADTTSFELIENVIQPNTEIKVYPDNSIALTALQSGGTDGIDGIVVDLQTAIFMRDAELEDFGTPEPEGTVVGQFAESAQVDQMGIVLELDSPLTECVNHAIATIKANGTLDAIYEQWITSGEEIPFFEE